MNNKHYIFVYGSLKKGFGNHRLIKDSEFIGKFKTQKKYHMVSFGAFPAVLEYPAKHYVSGELYAVGHETLIDLDILEGEGYLYKKQTIKLSGFNDYVWMYFYIAKDDDWSYDNVMVKGNVVKWF